MKKKFLVANQANGMRLDLFLVDELESLSRNKIKNLIEGGHVTVDGKVKKAKTLLKVNEKVEVDLDPAAEKKIALYHLEIPIVYEDQDILVVEKPDDLVVHPPSRGYQKTLVNALKGMGKKLSGGGELRPGVVHRLDKETSGLLVLAKRKSAYESLGEQFKKREVQKEYRAIVWGKFKQNSLTVNLPLTRDRKNRKMKVGMTQSKEAVTKVEVIKRFKDSTLLALKLITGRMHQIRVHLNFLGYPIVGDKKYGKKDGNDRLLLHAHRLEFFHPAHGTFLTFQSSVPQKFLEFFLAKE